MFTGIIQEVGKVSDITRSTGVWKLGVVCDTVYKDAKVSDSIAINGVCLTVVDKENNKLFFDVVKTTLEDTTFKWFRQAAQVNLESSLKVGDKLGGHFVLGHIDCASRIKNIQRITDSVILQVAYSSRFRKILVEKGSVAIEGISLTVQKVYNSIFSVSIIPYTFSHTNLRYKKAGDWVNIEFDYLLKGR